MPGGAVVRGGAEDWIALPLDKSLFANLDQDAVVGHQTAIENGFINELGGHTRFPGLVEFCTLPDNGRVYLYDFMGDLLAATSKGRVYRIGQNGTVTDVTNVPISGGRRVIFAKNNQEAWMAAGGQIIRLRSTKTELLSPDAPLTSHIACIDNIVVAVAINSQLWYYSNPGYPDQWPDLNTFSADSSPDNASAFIIDDFRDLIFGGLSAIEQWQRVPTGNTPFYRQWAIGEGVKSPYCLLSADNAVWTVNKLSELVKINQQITASVSNDIGLILEGIDDWTDAWLGGYPNSPCHVVGQKFMILQMPNATNAYGTTGVTLLYDYRNKRWSTLYGWDPTTGLRQRWPGWSHWRLWDQVFVGGEGKIYTFTTDTYTNDGVAQPWLTRTSHISEGNQFQIRDFRLQIKRGSSGTAVAPNILVRCSRDGRSFGPWIKRDLGLSGDRMMFKNFGGFGVATTFLFEISSTDDTPIDLVKAEIKGVKIGH
jgi:hypothetical protein